MLNRNLSLVLSLSSLVAAAGCGVADTETADSAATGDKRYIVKYVPGKGDAARAAAKGHGGDVVVDLDRHQAFAAYLPEPAVAALANNPAIAFVEPDQLRQALTQETPYGIAMVQANDPATGTVDEVTNGPPGGRKVCIIDSGFHASHEDRQDLNVSGTNTKRAKRFGGGELAWNQDGCGHGTHVAGTIAAANNELGVVGIAPFAPAPISLHIVRVFDTDCRWTYSSSLVSALDLCVAAGSNVVNMSLGGGSASTVERDAFAAAAAKGVLSIAASGNEHDETVSSTTPYSYPASYDSVVSVAAIDANMNVAEFSNRNNQVDLAAPGVGVLSTVPWHSEGSLTIGTEALAGGHMEGTKQGTVTGTTVDGGLCGTVGADWAGKIVLCQRGTFTFVEKVNNVAAGGGTAAVIYNSEAGGCGDFGASATSTTVIGITLSCAEGAAALLQLGASATVVGTFTAGASGYEAWNGTSMASPHVAGVAALVWSHNPRCTAAEVRTALTASALDLGDANRDDKFGSGLVQAVGAIGALTCAGPVSCTADSDCGSTQVCDVDTGTCVAAPTGPQACTAADDRATGCSCTSNAQCYFGQCKGKPNNKTCN